MKKLLFVLLFAAMALGLSAQTPVRILRNIDPFARRFTLGVEGGLGSVSHWYTEGDITGKPDFSAALGLSGYLRLSDQWFLIAQPQYEWRNPQGDFHSGNLIMPVSIATSLRIRNPHTQATNRMFFAIGPYYGYTLSGKSGGQKLDFDAWNRSEFGFQANISYFMGRWGLGITARESVTNLLKNKQPGIGNLQNQSAFFSLSYMF